MSRRSFPRIDPSALRDHADEARVDRVWERIEHDVAARLDRRESTRGRQTTFAYVAIAAALGAFGAGLWVGKATWDRKAMTAEALVAAPAIDKARVEVLAAGSQSRIFPLEGGGQVTLSPGATAEVERAGTALTLSLLQGEASIDARGRKALAVVAGEARIETRPGAMLSVRRNAEDLDVSVSDGMVSVSSPAGTQQLGKNERAEAVAMHAAVARTTTDTAPRRNPALPARRPTNKRPIALKGVAQPEWLARAADDEEGALTLLRKQGVDQAIGQARSAAELMAIADLMRHKGRDPGAAMRALRRVVDSFPGDQNVVPAATTLADIYQAQGDTALADQYRERAKLQATMADAFYCNLIDQETDKTKAAERAMDYLRRYPHGQCTERIRELLQADDVALAGDPAPSAVPAAPPGPPAPTAPAAPVHPLQ